MSVIFAAMLLLVRAPTPAHAQTISTEDVSLTLGGMVQAEASYGSITRAGEDARDRVGFTLRRTRLRATARIGPRAGVFMHLDADNGTFGVLDAYAFYEFNPRVRLRLGRMASAQPAAFIPTPVMAMDATERAAIALLWSGTALGFKGRDFGVDLRYFTGPVELIVFLHNGYGSFDVLSGNFQTAIVGDVTGGTDRNLGDLAVSTSLTLRPEAAPGLEVGGFAGFNGSGNPNTVQNGTGRDYFSYAAHAYWGALPGSQSIRLKADLIGVRYEELDVAPRQHTLGLSALGAVAVHEAAELFGRFETYDPYLDQDVTRNFFVTAGISFSPSRLRGRPFQQERLTFGYSARIPDDADAPLHHLVTLQAQFFF